MEWEPLKSCWCLISSFLLLKLQHLHSWVNIWITRFPISSYQVHRGLCGMKLYSRSMLREPSKEAAVLWKWIHLNPSNILYIGTLHTRKIYVEWYINQNLFCQLLNNVSFPKEVFLKFSSSVPFALYVSSWKICKF